MCRDGGGSGGRRSAWLTCTHQRRAGARRRVCWGLLCVCGSDTALASPKEGGSARGGTGSGVVRTLRGRREQGPATARVSSARPGRRRASQPPCVCGGAHSTTTGAGAEVVSVCMYTPSGARLVTVAAARWAYLRTIGLLWPFGVYARSDERAPLQEGGVAWARGEGVRAPVRRRRSY